MPSDSKKKRAAAKKEAAKKRTLTKGKKDETIGACAGKHMFTNKLLFNITECFKLTFLEFSFRRNGDIIVTDYMCQIYSCE